MSESAKRADATLTSADVWIPLSLDQEGNNLQTIDKLLTLTDALDRRAPDLIRGENSEHGSCLLHIQGWQALMGKDEPYFSLSVSYFKEHHRDLLGTEQWNSANFYLKKEGVQNVRQVEISDTRVYVLTERTQVDTYSPGSAERTELEMTLAPGPGPFADRVESIRIVNSWKAGGIRGVFNQHDTHERSCHFGATRGTGNTVSVR